MLKAILSGVLLKVRVKFFIKVRIVMLERLSTSAKSRIRKPDDFELVGSFGL